MDGIAVAATPNADPKTIVLNMFFISSPHTKTERCVIGSDQYDADFTGVDVETSFLRRPPNGSPTHK
jgi:hypothetical protein